VKQGGRRTRLAFREEVWAVLSNLSFGVAARTTKFYGRVLFAALAEKVVAELAVTDL
jgi:hypothetical protein